MEQVVDKIIAELNSIAETPVADGGIAEILKIESVYYGDPGIIPVWLYPAILEQPIRDAPLSETTGYEIRNLEILISLIINSTEFFEKDVEEAKGDRKLTQAADAIRKWLRRVANRRLDGEAGNVREVAVDATNYMVEVRGSVIAKSAQITLTVNKQYEKRRE
jgi:hypothetical protein